MHNLWKHPYIIVIPTKHKWEKHSGARIATLTVRKFKKKLHANSYPMGKRVVHFLFRSNWVQFNFFYGYMVAALEYEVQKRDFPKPLSVSWKI